VGGVVVVVQVFGVVVADEFYDVGAALGIFPGHIVGT
jgi:hypothetical protein